MKKIRIHIFLTLLVSYQCSYAETDTTFISRVLSNLKSWVLLPWDEADFDSGRRIFLKQSGGAIAGAALASSGGSNVVLGSLKSSSRLPDEVRRRLMALRRVEGKAFVDAQNALIEPRKAFSLNSHGLESYRTALEKEFLSTSNPQVKRVVAHRLNQLKRFFDDPDLMSMVTDTRPRSLELGIDKVSKKRIERKLRKVKERILKSQKEQSLELQVLLARSLIDNMLLKKIVYQLSFTKPEKHEYSLVLNEEEVGVIKKYRSVIAKLEAMEKKSFRRAPFLSKWLPLLKEEADQAVEMYELSKKALRVSLKKSCDSFL